ncbi:hypothetical protein Sta7437_1376 [Stanieria cyanosphaera PCC 7437]|uniref:Uncharacterized protein n=1 Tax=Stanieria cyanosphaera (strain ATCC 29371 / PCC 7437) TaxID=111780 RepID=K9XQY6_STAC7|nr:hypothetical protein [Stanieria cyanosphaera]AFZ34943.1 hypothetical protein Sta7437_1376 [Stanieria cyanosphaera PCC 7437]
MSSQLNHEPEIKARQTTLFDRTFRDSEGRIVLAQKPNLPIIVGLTATLLQPLFTNSKLQTGLDLVAFGALFTWAWLELFEGVNYFRRTLGGLVLVGLLAFKIYSSGNVNF